ncbi:MAG: hypothetical protein ACRDHX_03565, partial [Chloroflexota bacterium]
LSWCRAGTRRWLPAWCASSCVMESMQHSLFDEELEPHKRQKVKSTPGSRPSEKAQRSTHQNSAPSPRPWQSAFGVSFEEAVASPDGVTIGDVTTDPCSGPDELDRPQMTKEEYEQLDHIVVAGRQTFVAVGQALAAIRDQHGFRWAYSSFESYCQAALGYGRQRAQQYIDAAKVSTIVDKAGMERLPNEGQARELAQLLDRADTPTAIRTVLETARARAQSSERSASGKLVKSVREELYPDAARQPRSAKTRASASSTKLTELEDMPAAAASTKLPADSIAATATSTDLFAIKRIIAIEPRQFLLALGPGAALEVTALARSAIAWFTDLITEAKAA